MKGGENMNAIVMMMQMGQQPRISSSNPAIGKSSTNAFTLALEEKMNTMPANLSTELTSAPLDLVTEDQVKAILAQLSELLQIDQESLEALSFEELKLYLEDLQMGLGDKDLVLALQKLLESKQVNLLDATYMVPIHPAIEQSTLQQQQTILEHYTSLFHEARQLLAQVADEQAMNEVAPRLLALLEKWSKLDKLDQQSLEQLQKVMNQHPREGQLWNELLTAFEKRHQLALNKQYQLNAGVTKQDIASWLSRALAADMTTEVTTMQANVNITNMPMTKLEQYVIHIQQGQGAEPADKQMIDQLQQMIKSQRLLTLNNGFKQLTIHLRPENLGNMMVRLTELNGELTVKILVSSQATRQMLEANIHQLKHMFAPHQVIIEESNELNIQNIAEEHEHQDQSLEEHEESDGQDQQQQQAKEEVSESFQDVLMNLKV